MKTTITSASPLPVMEHFYTIQGEGFHQGRAAYFVRLGGCDVGCTWCDVKESWEADKHPLYTIEQIAETVASSGTEICVITGGEPLMHSLDALTHALHQKNIRTHIETSGAHPLSGQWDWICLSPKRFKLPLPECLKSAHELKVVVAHRNDLRFAEEHAAKVSEKCLLYLQPEWSKEKEVLPLIIEHVKQHPQWRISLQVHKYINVP